MRRSISCCRETLLAVVVGTWALAWFAVRTTETGLVGATGSGALGTRLIFRLSLFTAIDSALVGLGGLAEVLGLATIRTATFSDATGTFLRS